jgi:branched-chain amino acid transport system substrate-binding protein
MMSKKPIWRGAALAAVASLALAGCGGSNDNGDTGSNGDSGKTLIISSDLPLQGSSKDASAAMNNAIKLYLEQVGNKAGKFKIQFKSYDDSTAAKGAWDDATCAKNAQDHVANADEVAVMGTYNSGCAKIEVPVLNQDPDGPMLMVSHANTNPGLTKAWDPGEPDKFYPTGSRNYARVVTTDDFQGTADSAYVAKDLGKKNCFVLNDNQTYGQGVATAFVNNAKKIGLNILGNQPWDAK